jgi:prepilin-type N-terminal cleavage/methylation domain-containing protein
MFRVTAKGAGCGGFTLAELLVAMSVATVVLSGAVYLFSRALDGAFVSANNSATQQSVRAAMNMMHRDFSLTGTGLPQGGVSLPSGNGASASLFGCDAAQCYLANGTWLNNHLYPVMPDASDTKLPTIVGVATQAATVVYVDPAWQSNALPIVAMGANGTSVTLSPSLNAASTTQGVQTGDVMLLTNPNGNAAAVVTSVSGNVLNLADHDVLNINQSGASAGNVKALGVSNLPLVNNVPQGTTPVTTAVRLFVVTYFLQLNVDGTYRLMRKVNGQPPMPVADSLENLQFTYDVFNDTSGVATAGLADAGISLGMAPSQVRKINYTVTCKTTDLKGNVVRVSMNSSASARSLSFKDHYD